MHTTVQFQIIYRSIILLHVLFLSVCLSLFVCIVCHYVCLSLRTENISPFRLLLCYIYPFSPPPLTRSPFLLSFSFLPLSSSLPLPPSLPPPSKSLSLSFTQSLTPSFTPALPFTHSPSPLPEWKYVLPPFSCCSGCQTPGMSITFTIRVVQGRRLVFRCGNSGGILAGCHRRLREDFLCFRRWPRDLRNLRGARGVWEVVQEAKYLLVLDQEGLHAAFLDRSRPQA